MESTLDPHDELRRLQDKVRKLELQNEQLRSQQSPRNGLDFDMRPNILPSLPDLDKCNRENDFLKPEELLWENFGNEELWLYVVRSGSDIPLNIRSHLRQDIDNQCDYQVQSVKKKLVDKILEIEQGSRRNFIDTGTFTRSKKRVTRPGLEGIGDRSIFSNHQVLGSPFTRLVSSQISEVLDDVSMNVDSCLLSFDSSSSLNTTFRKDSANLNATIVKVSPDTKILAPVNSTFVKYDNDMCDYKSSDSDRSSSSRKISDSSLNTTCILGTNAIHNQTVGRIKNTALNSTFTNIDNNRTFVAAGDSGGDDDQLSSASDSSFSSNTRLMNVGDVQNIARLQEENLKQMTSTPKRDNSRDGIIVHGEDSLSPIKQVTPDLQQGYASDHSDHSSVGGRSKSSVRSSPSCSPFGSTIALANEFRVPSVQRREMHPASLKQEALRLEPSSKSNITGQRRVMSGLRPPTVRPISSRPSTAGSSNIPRPASRIPAPRVRSAYTTQQSAPKDWMDDCY